MDDDSQPATRKAFPSVSPYLLRPLRSYEQALADIAAKKKPTGTVTIFPPATVVEKTRTTRKTAIAVRCRPAA